MVNNLRTTQTTLQIKAILILQPRIIHSFFNSKTTAVNKFCLLSFVKISLDRKNFRSGVSADRRI
jgi:hypothetical protein